MSFSGNHHDVLQIFVTVREKPDVANIQEFHCNSKKTRQKNRHSSQAAAVPDLCLKRYTKLYKNQRAMSSGL
jgi:hypothetical protein